MPVQKGDKIRILQTGLLGARVEAGDELEVLYAQVDAGDEPEVFGRIHPGGRIFITESPRSPGADGWWFTDRHEGTGWERVEPS